MPSVVSAVKSGASSPSRSAISCISSWIVDSRGTLVPDMMKVDQTGRVFPGVLMTRGSARSATASRSPSGARSRARICPRKRCWPGASPSPGSCSWRCSRSPGRSLLPAPGERRRAFLLGAIGYAVESSFFYAGLQRGTAAAVALLFYSYPLGGRPDRAGAEDGAAERPRSFGALALGLVGSGTIVAAGSDVSITTAGVLFTLASATCFSRLPHREQPAARTQRRAGTSGAWTALGAGLSLHRPGAVYGVDPSTPDRALGLAARHRRGHRGRVRP